MISKNPSSAVILSLAFFIFFSLSGNTLLFFFVPIQSLPVFQDPAQVYFLHKVLNIVPALYLKFNSVQFSCSVVSQLFVTPWTVARQASLSTTNSQNPPKPVSIKSVMPSNHLILCRPLLLPPPIPPSIRVFSNESALGIRWPKYWSFIFNISPSNEHPGLISFRMDWLHLLAVQGTLKSLLKTINSSAVSFLL